MSIELIIGNNDIEVTKNNLDISIINGDNNVSIENQNINVGLSSGENDIELLLDNNSKDINVDISNEEKSVSVLVDNSSLDILNTDINIDISDDKQDVEVLNSQLDLEIIAQPFLQSNNVNGTIIKDAICSPTDSVGDCVYELSNYVSEKFVVEKCDITDFSKMPAIGIIISKSSNTDCKVQTYGLLDSFFSSLITRKILFIGIDSKLSNTPPYSSTQNVFQQNFGVSISDVSVIIVPNYSLIKKRP